MTAARTQVARIQVYVERDGGLNWRLLAANHRELGRGPGAYTALAECQASLRGLRQDLAVVATRVRRADGQRWTWQVLRGDVVVARAGSTFDRGIRAQQAVAAFLSQVADAPLGPFLDLPDAPRRCARPRRSLLADVLENPESA